MSRRRRGQERTELLSDGDVVDISGIERGIESTTGGKQEDLVSFHRSCRVGERKETKLTS